MTDLPVTKRIARDMEEIDRLPPALRACVYEFGFEIVRVCMSYGIVKPNQIRNLVREIWAGARQPTQRKNRASQSRALNAVDWVLIQSGCDITAERLIRTLDYNGIFIAPQGVAESMVIASMSAIDGMGPLTKYEKHKIRLKAALKAGRNLVIKEVEAA